MHMRVSFSNVLHSSNWNSLGVWKSPGQWICLVEVCEDERSISIGFVCEFDQRLRMGGASRKGVQERVTLTAPGRAAGGRLQMRIPGMWEG